MSNFHVGQRVCCVDDEKSKELLKRGGIYTVRGLRTETGINYILLEEIPNAVYFPGWYPHRFRPVHTTSIEIFQKMLTPVPRKEFADT